MDLLKRLKAKLRSRKAALASLYEINEVAIQAEIARRQRNHPNPLCRFGKYGFSQSDEDGLTIEIVRRIGLSTGSFCEFGVGDGLENNTLILLSLGWRGGWVGGQALCFDPFGSNRLRFHKTWVTDDNVLEAYAAAFGSNESADVISLDLDGNDYYLCRTILDAGVRPKLFIVEYNAIFPPPVEFKIEYDAKHTWTGDNYFGASLSSFAKLFSGYGYSLICCNAATGGNAFFVRNEDADKFPEVPSEIELIYSDPFYFVPKRVGHKRSVRTIERLLRD